LTTDRNATLDLVLVHQNSGLEALRCSMAVIAVVAIKDMVEVHPSRAWASLPTKKLTTLTLMTMEGL